MRRFATKEQLSGVVAEVFGTDRRIVSATRLPNGSKKGVYRLALDDATTAVVYIWDPAEDYWSDVQGAERADAADTFSHASGLDLFEAEPLTVLAQSLRRMHDHPAPRFGKVAVVEQDLPVNGESGARVILDRALADVEEAASATSGCTQAAAH